MTRKRLYLLGFVAALLLAAAVAAYNIHGALSFEWVPPGKMSWLSLAGLNDLQRGQLTSEALKPQALLASLFLRSGFGQISSIEIAAVIFFSAVPVVVGIFARLVTRSLLVGGASALLLSLVPFGYLSAVQGDYSLVAAVALIFAALSPALLFLRGRSVVWLAISVGISVFAGLSTLSAALVLLLTCVVWAVYSVLRGEKRTGLVAVPGVAALAVSLAVPRAGAEQVLRQASLGSSMPSFAGELGLIYFAGVVGGAVILLTLRWDSVPVLAFVGSGLALILTFGWEGVLLVIPAVALLAVAPLAEARRIFAVVPPSVVEVDVERTFAVGVAFLTFSSPILAGLGPGLAIQGSNYLGPEELSALNQVKALNPSLFGQGLVVAPSIIAPWLRADLGVKTLVPLTANQSATVDAVTSTSFRLRSNYLMVDDWTPMSFVRSPLISAYDGLEYAPVLHLDDGQNRVNFTYGKQVLSEDIAQMRLTGHSFSQNSHNMTLTLYLTKLGIDVVKQMTVSKAAPTLAIAYAITPQNGTDLLSFSLPTYIEGEQHIVSAPLGSSIGLTMTSSNLSLSFIGGSAPKLFLGGTEGYVKSTFNTTAGTIRATVDITVESAKDSGTGDSYASLLDAIKNDGISSLVTFTPPPGLNFLSYTIVQPEPSIEVKDAFSRVLINSGGTNFIEAPSYATVLSQNVTDSCDATFKYKTAGLNITKSLSSSGNVISLSYQVTPWKAYTTVSEMNVTLWVPLDRSLIGYGSSSNPGSVLLSLDSGAVEIRATTPNLLGAEIGPDTTYGQDRLLLHFRLNPLGDNVGVRISFGGIPGCQQELTSRPTMNGADELIFSMSSGLFSQVFSDSNLTVYRLAQVNQNETA